MVVQRYLRPGQYELIVKVEDLNSKRVFREARQIDVPSVKPQPRMTPLGLATSTASSVAPASRMASSWSGDGMSTPPKRSVVSFGMKITL